MNIFYMFETNQNARYLDRATLHVPNLVGLQQFRSRYEDVEDAEWDCVQCEKRKNSFWDDMVGEMLALG